MTDHLKTYIRWCYACRAAPTKPGGGMCHACRAMYQWDQNARRANFRPAVEYETGILFGCLLHLGFLSVEETPEQLARLSRHDNTYADGHARSRVCRTYHLLTPIDRVAARVAPAPRS